MNHFFFKGFWRKILSIFTGLILFYLLTASWAISASVLDVALNYSCGIKPDNMVICWGSVPEPPPNDPFSQISLSTKYACGLKTDNTVACWGKDQIKQQFTPPEGTFLQVSAGYEHTCGVRTDNTVVCWGVNDKGQATPPNDTFLQVSAGAWHTCGIRTDNTLACWGSNQNAWNLDKIAGQATPPSGQFSKISAGKHYSCGIQFNDTLTCWGINADTQATPPIGTFSQFNGGNNNSCGVGSNNNPICWGWNEVGQAKPPHSTCISRAEKSPKALCSMSSNNLAFSDVSTNGGERSSHSCGVLTDGTVICWGDNKRGQATPPPCLRLKSSGTQIEENLPYGILYGVHADGNKDSQFFTLDSRVLEANPLGEVYESYDIVGIANHPITRQIWTISGNKASQKGYLYQIDRNKGVRFSELGKTGFNTVVDISFHPEGTLWGWAQGEGLFKIENDDNNEPDIKTIELVLAYTGEIKIEDLTWNTSGTILYVLENLYEKATQDNDESAAKKGIRLWTYTQSGKINTVCDSRLNSLGEEIEAVTTLPSDNDTLLVHFSGHENLMFGVIDIPTCQIIQKEIPTNYYAIEREPKNNFFGVRNYNNVKSLAWIACQP